MHREVPDLDRGSLVGRYVILDVVGQGGMGVVYAAYNPKLDRKVAVKLLQAKQGKIGSTAGGQVWLQREAQAQAQLAHPNVLAVYDVGTLSDDRVFVAMELVEGQTLRAWLDAEQRRGRASSRWSRRPAPGSRPRIVQGSCIATSSRRTCWSGATVARA